MTRQDYIILARALCSSRPNFSSVAYEQWEKDVDAIRVALAKDEKFPSIIFSMELFTKE